MSETAVKLIWWLFGAIVSFTHFWYSFGAWFDVPAHAFYTKANSAPRYDALWPWLSLPVARLMRATTGPLAALIVIFINSVVVAAIVVTVGRLALGGIKQKGRGARWPP